MLKTLKLYYDFCNKKNQKKIVNAMLLGILKSIFATLRIPAIAVILDGILKDNMTMKHVCLSLIIMLISILG
ncbi:MAG: ABC transporter ATP-binding protein, partial [Lachnospiraceae bacterium]|nr:ABC transporter ATP-binding protein [Lachnospiraceae bacterium]